MSFLWLGLLISLPALESVFIPLLLFGSGGNAKEEQPCTGEGAHAGALTGFLFLFLYVLAFWGSLDALRFNIPGAIGVAFVTRASFNTYTDRAGYQWELLTAGVPFRGQGTDCMTGRFFRESHRDLSSLAWSRHKARWRETPLLKQPRSFKPELIYFEVFLV